jgi:GntR family transcriptional repressor for pyruvate dehydrogenase complex
MIPTKRDSIFRTIKKVRLADTVVDQVTSLIENGQLKPGDQLPSERELVNEFRIARPSIREALRILEFQGVIEVRPGKGAFVVGLGDGPISDEQRVLHWFREYATEALEILDVRASLEVLAAELAATRATDEQFDAIEAALEEAQVAASDGRLDDLVRLDRVFHQRVASASGNHLLSALIDMLVDALVDPRRSLLRLPARASTSWHEHEAILKALRSRDPHAATTAVKGHMAHVRSNIVALRDGSLE